MLVNFFFEKYFWSFLETEVSDYFLITMCLSCSFFTFPSPLSAFVIFLLLSLLLISASLFLFPPFPFPFNHSTPFFFIFDFFSYFPFFDSISFAPSLRTFVIEIKNLNVGRNGFDLCEKGLKANFSYCFPLRPIWHRLKLICRPVRNRNVSCFHVRARALESTKDVENFCQRSCHMKELKILRQMLENPIQKRQPFVNETNFMDEQNRSRLLSEWKSGLSHTYIWLS